MKKILVIFIIFLLLYLSLSLKKEIIIPNAAIRFRVVANSDSDYDQDVKKQVKDNLEVVLNEKLDGVENINTAKNILVNSIPNLKNIVDNTLVENKADYDFSVNYGYNYFPDKKYKGVTYKNGNYESLVITLGNGNGSNWWCVMFPPLCLVDAEEDYDTSTTEYRLFIKDMIDKYF